MLQALYNSESKDDNRIKVGLIYGSFKYFENKVEKMLISINKKEPIKVLNIVNKILDFNEQNQWRQGLKILTPSQMLSRLPISLA